MAKTFISKLDSYALITIALLAVVVSIWQVNHQRKHDRISLMPYVSWITESQGDTISHKVWNKGAGPAIITDYSFEINDSSFNSWGYGFSFADSTIVPIKSMTFGTYILAPNEVLTLVVYKTGIEKDGTLQINISFKSVYGDKEDDYMRAPL